MAERNGNWVGDYRKHGQSRRRHGPKPKRLYDHPGFGIALDAQHTTRTIFSAFGVTVWIHKSPWHIGYFGQVMNSARDSEKFEIEEDDPEKLKVALRAWIADKLFHSNTEEEGPSLSIDWLIKPLEGVA